MATRTYFVLYCRLYFIAHLITRNNKMPYLAHGGAFTLSTVKLYKTKKINEQDYSRFNINNNKNMTMNNDRIMRLCISAYIERATNEMLRRFFLLFFFLFSIFL